MERATELEFLQWFYCYADFGPADGDVRDNLKDEFTKMKKLLLPIGYDNTEEG